ncbi:2-oxo acid dehydrogenase subunit E2 [Geomonas sp. RF6]|uniref:dihydrolipoamide acetyltransferase family protein n=1 Tax=Geomonas sp. RF6 TaxID=2897342 RepID=UPI001E58467B|nr:dihydrolipoamide acetyltransferase family protein [Geomonas sp. RF6]UFS70903.1 2-oxo acid dehydrogenase subunit E2 [Geomonas sp. RF6]
MPYEFKLPDLGEGISEVELRRWLVREGDEVAEHQPVVEVETDKAVVEVPSPRKGLVVRLHRKEGETVPVGEILVTISEGTAAEGSEQAPQQAIQEAMQQPTQVTQADELPPQRPKSVGIVGTLPEAEEEPQQEQARPQPQREAHGKDILATPSVRKTARERGIDLSRIQGSGPRGSVTPEDLERFAPSREGAPAEGMASMPPLQIDPGDEVERVPMRGVRRSTARNVIASQRVTASVTTTEEADITELAELRDREQKMMEGRGRHLTFLPFFIKAVQHALREHPYLNASIEDATSTIILKKRYHFGIAVDTPNGLMVPVIRDVEKKSIFDLAGELLELGKKARERTIAIEEMKGSSFTVTNYGHFGGGFATPVINWPDVAILGFGRIADRAWVHKGQVAVRKIVPMSLTFDHRATDGVDASRFLTKVVQYLEDPGLFLIDSV